VSIPHLILFDAGHSLTADERHELMELSRKLRQVQMARDIFAKPMAWFSSNGDKTFTPSMR
jgi:transposase